MYRELHPALQRSYCFVVTATILNLFATVAHGEEFPAAPPVPLQSQLTFSTPKAARTVAELLSHLATAQGMEINFPSDEIERSLFRRKDRPLNRKPVTAKSYWGTLKQLCDQYDYRVKLYNRNKIDSDDGARISRAKIVDRFLLIPAIDKSPFVGDDRRHLVVAARTPPNDILWDAAICSSELVNGEHRLSLAKTSRYTSYPIFGVYSWGSPIPEKAELPLGKGRWELHGTLRAFVSRNRWSIPLRGSRDWKLGTVGTVKVDDRGLVKSFQLGDHGKLGPFADAKQLYRIDIITLNKANAVVTADNNELEYLWDEQLCGSQWKQVCRRMIGKSLVRPTEARYLLDSEPLPLSMLTHLKPNQIQIAVFDRPDSFAQTGTPTLEIGAFIPFETEFKLDVDEVVSPRKNKQLLKESP
ncbi:hypothetical protein [Stratiformator vulcanicus]|uniref:Uncharacterized protein n=1 Tax=Stratiformator vulcanicus TaxID=2527980 RepID=A0A517R3H7_9PLAN|nr:hypothetical protein [Stratiformator vulcanicus]QDT38449.1 hypothetical protein Pan189_28430 [Stratiformator vulcanicus]